MGDIIQPGGGPVYFPTGDELDPDDDRDKFKVCVECNTHLFLGDEVVCSICRRVYCDECYEDHDCGFLEAQAEAADL